MNDRLSKSKAAKTERVFANKEARLAAKARGEARALQNTPAIRAGILKRYRDGEKLVDIANEMGWKYQRVCVAVRKARIEERRCARW